jgi:hypothetical protein
VRTGVTAWSSGPWQAFIKDDSIGKVLYLNHAGKTGPFRKLSIKQEVDTNPPVGSRTEIKYLDFPFISSVTVQDRPSLFAGKNAHPALPLFCQRLGLV